MFLYIHIRISIHFYIMNINFPLSLFFHIFIYFLFSLCKKCFYLCIIYNSRTFSMFNIY